MATAHLCFENLDSQLLRAGQSVKRKRKTIVFESRRAHPVHTKNCLFLQGNNIMSHRHRITMVCLARKRFASMFKTNEREPFLKTLSTGSTKPLQLRRARSIVSPSPSAWRAYRDSRRAPANHFQTDCGNDGVSFGSSAAMISTRRLSTRSSEDNFQLNTGYIKLMLHRRRRCSLWWRGREGTGRWQQRGRGGQGRRQQRGREGNGRRQQRGGEGRGGGSSAGGRARGGGSSAAGGRPHETAAR